MEPHHSIHHGPTLGHDLSDIMAARPVAAHRSTPVPVRPTSPVRADLGALCLPNPGGIAVVSVYGPRHPDIPGLARGLTAVRCLGRGPEWTNNSVAYEAALSALRIIYGSGWRGPVVLRTTSQVLMNLYSGACGCYVPELQNRLHRLRRAGGYFSDLTVEWIPRTENVRADALARRAYADALRAERAPL